MNFKTFCLIAEIHLPIASFLTLSYLFHINYELHKKKKEMCIARKKKIDGNDNIDRHWRFYR